MNDRRGLPLIGRQRELVLLRGSFEEATRLRPQVVLITGEPGVGKSTLVDTFLELSHQATQVGQRSSTGQFDLAKWLRDLGVDLGLRSG